MTERIRHCPMCHLRDVGVIYENPIQHRLECNYCCFRWTDTEPWRSLPLTEEQAAWLGVRGLSCDGSRGHAADIIGHRIPWRKEPPTEAQAAWFAERQWALPKTSGEAAKQMYYAFCGRKENVQR